MPSPENTTTVGGFGASERIWVLLVFGGLGAGAGAVLPYVTGWVSGWPWVPFQGPLELVSSFDQTWLTWGRPVLGLLIGLTHAAWIVVDHGYPWEGADG